MSLADDRLRDLLLMAFAIQLSILGTAPPDDSLLPLLLVGVLLMLVVFIRELTRWVDEYTARSQ